MLQVEFTFILRWRMTVDLGGLGSDTICPELSTRHILINDLLRIERMPLFIVK